MTTWKHRWTGSECVLMLCMWTQVFRQSCSALTLITQQEDPVNQRKRTWGCNGGAKHSSPPQREGPCSWAADESWPADRGPSAGGRCYCAWELHTTEESLPLTDVSFRAPCTAWHCSLYTPYIRYCSRACAAEKILCRTNSPFFPSLYGSMSMCTVCFRFCLQWSFFVYIYHQGLVLLVHRGYSLYEQRFSLSSQITQSLRSQSVYIKTVYSVVQRFTTTYKYEAKILKDNLC